MYNRGCVRFSPDFYGNMAVRFSKMFQNITKAYAYFHGRTERAARNFTDDVVVMGYLVICPWYALIMHLKRNELFLCSTRSL